MSSTENTRAGASRARLVEAAVTAFAERGFHGTSTRDIAAAAGMSPAAVYVHHRSKEDLLYLISRVGHDDTVAVIRQAADSTDDPAARLAAVMRAFALHHAREHTRARIVNYELNALSREHLAEISAIRRQIRLDVQAMIQDGVDAGVFDTPDPAKAAMAVLSLGIDIARWYRDDGSWTPEEIADFYADLALRVVGAGRR
ncbi:MULTISPECIES: TetR/AcrR family transcriptional regulator [Thermocrispum]|jgi:AcrR family transcriptional regulator|uniref:TetR/AcrR family transcriptional regulator n=1 Tax=Thermocrispum agreste TaxID=37925 RepID=A0ABD6FAB8_9PSEU|nr:MULTISPECIES: TetR/AcrR family transcriptional regulator [Thermocrispum]